eukprot:m.1034384 g.1034384  ORF g.1034384 m.1034384 type:complete len:70 (+) comp24135_c0_seq30:334-543(+)
MFCFTPQFLDIGLKCVHARWNPTQFPEEVHLVESCHAQSEGVVRADGGMCLSSAIPLTANRVSVSADIL